METYGWLYNAKLVADFEGVPLDSVFDFKIIRFLNDLGYIKAKDLFDRANAKHTE